jgi:hypothetical protein
MLLFPMKEINASSATSLVTLMACPRLSKSSVSSNKKDLNYDLPIVEAQVTTSEGYVEDIKVLLDMDS